MIIKQSIKKAKSSDRNKFIFNPIRGLRRLIEIPDITIDKAVVNGDIFLDTTFRFLLEKYLRKPLNFTIEGYFFTSDQIESFDFAYEVQSIEYYREYQSSFFAQLVNPGDDKVLAWTYNILAKIQAKNGFIPEALLRDDSNKEFFDTFWRSVARYFSYYVEYMRKIQEFYENKELLIRYLRQKGMHVSVNNTIVELQELMENFHREIFYRGTNRIYERVEETGKVDGELLRLLWKDLNDEFMFVFTDKGGWWLNQTSPLYRSVNKELSNKIVNEKFSQTVFGYEDEVEILGSLVYEGKIIIDSRLDYSLNFNLLNNKNCHLKVEIIAYDEKEKLTSLYDINSGEVKSVIIDVDFSKQESFKPIALFIYSKYKKATKNSNDLKLHQDVKFISFKITVSENSAILKNISFNPLLTPSSTVFLDVNNWIDMWFINNNKYYNNQDLRNEIVESLIPYNTNLNMIDIENTVYSGSEDQDLNRFYWEGFEGYCVQLLWRGIEPFCLTQNPTHWIGEESSAFCLKERYD